MRQVLESHPEVRVLPEVHVVCSRLLRVRRLTETRRDFRKSPATLDSVVSLLLALFRAVERVRCRWNPGLKSRLRNPATDSDLSLDFIGQRN